MPPPPQPSRRLRPSPLSFLRPATGGNEPSLNSDASNVHGPHTQATELGKGTRKSRPRRRGRRAGSGNKAKAQRCQGSSDRPPSSDLMPSQDAPPQRMTPIISPPPSPPEARDGYSTPPHAFANAIDNIDAPIPHLERLERTQAPTIPVEVFLTTPPQTAEDFDDNIRPTFPISRTPDWPSPRSLSPSFGSRAARRPVYIGSHLPIATVNLPETKPFSLATPDFGGAELTLPMAYNPDYPHPLTAYASPGVNPATVSASGYAPHLRDLQETDPRATMGGILADCGNDNMTAPALSHAQSSKDGCGIPEKLWLRLSACAGVKVPIGAVLPAVLAVRGVSPRFLQSSTSPVSPTHSDTSLTSSRARGYELPDSPVSPIFSMFAQSQRLAASRSDRDLQRMLLDNLDAPQVSCISPNYERRGSLPDLRLGSKKNASLISHLHDELSRLQSGASRRRYEHHVMTNEELIREILISRNAAETRTAEPASSVGHLPRLHSRHASLGFDSLSTVDEADDDLHGSPVASGRDIKPIGAERDYRGQLPTLPLHIHQTSCADEEYVPRKSSRLSSGGFQSSPSSLGGMGGVTTPVETSFPPITPPATTGIFRELRRESLHPPGDERFAHGSRNCRSRNLLSHTHSHRVSHDSPPYCRSPPSVHAESDFLPCDAWHNTPTSTTLDFSTGKSIWS